MQREPICYGVQIQIQILNESPFLQDYSSTNLYNILKKQKHRRKPKKGEMGSSHLVRTSGGIQPVRTGSLEPVPGQSHILRTGY